MHEFPVVTQYPFYSAALAIIIKRLTHQMQPGGLLAGLKFTSKMMEVEEFGQADIPAIRIAACNIQESHAPGAPSTGNSNSDTPQTSIHDYRLALYTLMENGMIQLSPNGEVKKRGHLDWLGLVLDAIESETDTLAADALPETDARLEDTVMRPIVFRTEELEPIGMLLGSAIHIECYVRNFCRGHRHLTFPDLT
jgi:hypothetical protein